MRNTLLVLLLSTIGLTAYGQKYGDYIPGYIYDLQHVKSSMGLIKWTPPTINIFASAGDHLFFKLTPDDQRQKVKSTQFQSFVMAADSFVVSHDKQTEQYPILRVMFDKPVKLYARYRMTNYQGVGVPMGQNVMINYYFGPDPDHLTELTRKNFYEAIIPFIEDYPELVEDVKNKKYGAGAADEVLDVYFKHKKGLPGGK